MKLSGVNFIIGTTGGGKGLHGMRQLGRVLISKRDKRPIVTSEHSLDMDGLERWAFDKCGERIDAWRRITILRPEQCFTPWRIRGMSGDLELIQYRPVREAVEIGEGIVKEIIRWPVLHPDDKGVFYWIPDAFNFFKAMDFNKVTAEGEKYFAMCRHLGDCFLLDTHDFDLIAKPVRARGVVFAYCRNLGQESISIGTVPDTFVVNEYSSPVRKGSDTEKPMNTRTYTRDKVLSECYKTASQAGDDAEGDKNIESGKIDWRKWGVPAVAAAVLLVWFGIKGISALSDWWLVRRRTTQASAGGVPRSPGLPPAQPQNLASVIGSAVAGDSVPLYGRTLEGAPARVAAKAPQVAANQGTISWHEIRGGYHTFGLSDGRVIFNPRGYWNGRDLVIAGKVYSRQSVPFVQSYITKGGDYQ